MENKPIVQLSENVIHSNGNNRWSLRVIEYEKNDGTTGRKFGLGEYWFSQQAGRWFPDSKHHVYLPLSVWSKLVALGPIVESFELSTDGQGQGSGHPAASHAPREHPSDQPVAGRRGRTTKQTR